MSTSSAARGREAGAKARADSAAGGGGGETKDDVDSWLAAANKVAVEDDASTEKTLVADSLAALRKQAAQLDETRWLFEDMPANPETLEASVGV